MKQARTWPAWAVAGWLTGMAVGQITLAIALASGDYTVEEHIDGKTPLAYDLLATAALWVGFLGVPWLLTRLRGRGPVADLGLRARPADASAAILGVVCQYALVAAVSLPWVWILGRKLTELDDPARELTNRAGDTTSRVLLVLVVAIGAPIAEEIFFRGFLQRGLMAWVPPPAAIAASSLLFALTHFQLLQFPALAAFGAVLGVLAYRTGRLGPSIATHMGFNTVTVIALLLESR
jgi:membrane protease YdiL (CAAX protease family)